MPRLRFLPPYKRYIVTSNNNSYYPHYDGMGKLIQGSLDTLEEAKLYLQTNLDEEYHMRSRREDYPCQHDNWGEVIDRDTWEVLAIVHQSRDEPDDVLCHAPDPDEEERCPRC